MMKRKIPASLLLGSATAATQVEGGDMNVNWYDWSLKGKVGRGESSLTGADHYARFREDTEMMAEMGHQCYRMGVEWSRIEPERGVWSPGGLAHYRQELELIRSRGIVPMVTVHHFSCPQWFQEAGGWMSREAVELFLRFCGKIVEELGDLVCDWCTINEPNVFANDSYMDGKYPPGHEGDMLSYFKVSRRMVIAHLKAYKLIHKIRREKNFPGETMVGYAQHLAFFVSPGKGLFCRLGRGLIERLFHKIYLKGMIEGKLIFPLGAGYPEGRGIFCDYLGVNYYSRHIITPTVSPARLFGTVGFDPDLPKEKLTDLGWEIYPEGLAGVITPLWKKYALPVYITENGLADSSDEKRTAFIRNHLAVVLRLMEEGVDIRRYYYWSLMDNLEWNDGYGPRFGLVEIDYDTMERRPRPSALFYRALCRERLL